MKAHEVDLRRHPQTGLPNHLNWRPGGAQGAEQSLHARDIVVLWIDHEIPQSANAPMLPAIWRLVRWYIPVSELPVPPNTDTNPAGCPVKPVNQEKGAMT